MVIVRKYSYWLNNSVNNGARMLTRTVRPEIIQRAFQSQELLLFLLSYTSCKLSHRPPRWSPFSIAFMIPSLSLHLSKSCRLVYAALNIRLGILSTLANLRFSSLTVFSAFAYKKQVWYEQYITHFDFSMYFAYTFIAVILVEYTTLIVFNIHWNNIYIRSVSRC